MLEDLKRRVVLVGVISLGAGCGPGPSSSEPGGGSGGTNASAGAGGWTGEAGSAGVNAAAGTGGAAGTDGSGGASGAGASGSAGGKSTSGGTENGPGGKGGGGSTGVGGMGGGGYPDAFDPNDAPPKIGEPGCGFETAAFCDTFGAPATTRSRGGELDGVFWSGSRTFSHLSATRALGVGMAFIPECRPDLPDKVWPNQDALICEPTFDLQSKHLLVATAAQFYGQNSYRIRQPFDFAERTGRIVFDASTDPMNPLNGWISLAITEDPMSAPGYSIVGNDEGSIIPRNALEVHFANIGDLSKIGVRFLHVFDEHVDTVYSPPAGTTAAPRSQGKVNHFEFSISEEQVEVTITPFSEDGVTFEAPAQVYRQPVRLPFSRGYVVLSLHNHATLKYSNASDPGGLIDAAVARIDNVGFDGPVITDWRESSAPDSLVRFEGEPFQPVQDPRNPENIGYDIGYIVNDIAEGPGSLLPLGGVDPVDIESAALAVTLNVDFFSAGSNPAEYALQARVNGQGWHERKLTPAEVAFFTDGPTTLDAEGNPMGDPGSQGRLALMLDIPVEELVAGENTVEFVTVNVPRSYPPVVYNVDLVMRRR
jgi:hypothetical protein